MLHGNFAALAKRFCCMLDVARNSDPVLFRNHHLHAHLGSAFRDLAVRRCWGRSKAWSSAPSSTRCSAVVVAPASADTWASGRFCKCERMICPLLGGFFLGTRGLIWLLSGMNVLAGS